MKIDNIVFDFGGVLVDWNPRYLFENLFENKQDMEYFLSNICTSEWNVQQDAGRPLSEGTKILQEQYPEHKVMIQRFYDDWEVMLRDEIPENTRLIYELKERNYRLFGLTNWSAETFPIALERFPFFSELEGIVVSGEEKMIKPDKEIYFLLLDRYKLKAENSIFIDDNLENILAAKDIGFHTIHFNGSADIEQQLKEWKIL